MKNYILYILLAVTALPLQAQSLVYTAEDSIRVAELLAQAPVGRTQNEYMIHFATKLKDIPYVAKTLEVTPKENLIINLRELDCTTLVENVLALSLCMRDGKRSFVDFADRLRRIRYRKGHIAYTSRLHYFTSWIEENTENGFVKEVSDLKYPFSSIQTLRINFTTSHADAYPALRRDPALLPEIRLTEQTLTGRKYRYIPKHLLSDYSKLRNYINTGDIIVILTRKAGLDTSHIGIASWHKDGTLHLLNASQIHKKVIDEPMTLYRYMQKHQSQIGIRVVSPQP